MYALVSIFVSRRSPSRRREAPRVGRKGARLAPGGGARRCDVSPRTHNPPEIATRDDARGSVSRRSRRIARGAMRPRAGQRRGETDGEHGADLRRLGPVSPVASRAKRRAKREVPAARAPNNKHCCSSSSSSARYQPSSGDDGVRCSSSCRRPLRCVFAPPPLDACRAVVHFAGVFAPPPPPPRSRWAPRPLGAGVHVTNSGLDVSTAASAGGPRCPGTTCTLRSQGGDPRGPRPGRRRAPPPPPPRACTPSSCA